VSVALTYQNVFFEPNCNKIEPVEYQQEGEGEFNPQGHNYIPKQTNEVDHQVKNGEYYWKLIPNDFRPDMKQMVIDNDKEAFIVEYNKCIFSQNDGNPNLAYSFGRRTFT
jgi:hypothetical protein